MDLILIALLSAPPLTAVMAALRDLTTMTIPNWMSLALLVLFAPAVFVAGLEGGAVLTHVGIGLAALVLGMGLFAMRVIGGGDAKLMAALSLWMGPDAVLVFALWTAVAGGLFSLGLILLRGRVTVPARAPAWTARLLRPGGDIPYGVAIAAGGLLAWPASTLMRVAF